MVKKIKRAIKNSYIFLRDAYLKKKLLLAIKKKKPLKIIIGASGETFFSTVTQDGWNPTNVGFLDTTKMESFERYFKKNSLEAMLAEHVWEHMTLEEGMISAKNCYEFLKPGGHIRVAVPDGYNPDPNFIAYVDVNGTGPGAKDHKILYTYNTLSKVFENAGFKVMVLEYFDEHGTSHKNPWDPQDGIIHRSLPNYTSIIIDAIK